jgi:hypothetical protein
MMRIYNNYGTTADQIQLSAAPSSMRPGRRSAASWHRSTNRYLRSITRTSTCLWRIKAASFRAADEYFNVMEGPN